MMMMMTMTVVMMAVLYSVEQPGGLSRDDKKKHTKKKTSGDAELSYEAIVFDSWGVTIRYKQDRLKAKRIAFKWRGDLLSRKFTENKQTKRFAEHYSN